MTIGQVEFHGKLDSLVQYGKRKLHNWIELTKQQRLGGKEIVSVVGVFSSRGITWIAAFASPDILVVVIFLAPGMCERRKDQMELCIDANIVSYLF
jgi:hypothetical protein